MTDPIRDHTGGAWSLWDAGVDALHESTRDSRFAISNGLFGVRGVRGVACGDGWAVPTRTLVAGLYDTVRGAIPQLVAAPDWLRFGLSTPEGPLSLDLAGAPDHLLTLDLRGGLLRVDGAELKGPGVSLCLRTHRLVSLSDRAIGLQRLHLDVKRGEADITLKACFDVGDLKLVAESLEPGLGVWRTVGSGKRLAMAGAAAVQIDGQVLESTQAGCLSWRWTWRSRPGQVVEFQRLVALVRSGPDEADPGPEALRALGRAQGRGWEGVAADHEAAWAQRWRDSDVEVDGDPAAQQALRFALYHLNGAANPDDNRVSIGARALTGDDYLGHVFWDTEIYLLPFYALTWPAAARALLMYRFHTLDAARAKATRMGWRGALYAWESTDTGEETTPDVVVGPDREVVPVLNGTLEQHISADVAYAVWQYWLATGDEAFLQQAGAEILLETGRFWSVRAALEADGRYHIRHVIGPDEYHPDVDDNAFTNVMARWNIERALEVATLLEQRWPACWAELSARLGFDAAERDRMRSVAQAMATGFDASTALYEEFAGYFNLEAIDLAAYAGRSVPLDVVLGRERTARSQVVKQADVVALLALLPEAFPGSAGPKNFGYYAARCGHGSSLSRTMHGWVAARCGDTEVALDHFRRTAAIDLGDTHVAIAGGVHIAALGGLWLMAVFGFAGLTLRDDGLGLDPRLPDAWTRLAFPVQWRGRQLRIVIDAAAGSVDVSLEHGDPITIHIAGVRHRLSAEQPLRAPWERR